MRASECECVLKNECVCMLVCVSRHMYGTVSVYVCVCVCVSRHVQMYVPLISASVFWNTAVDIAVPSGLEGKKGGRKGGRGMMNTHVINITFYKNNTYAHVRTNTYLNLSKNSCAMESAYCMNTRLAAKLSMTSFTLPNASLSTLESGP
jgi:hypothetical protein